MSAASSRPPAHARARRRHGLPRHAPSAPTRVGAGEVCFNTSMTGYQEILTDPSYAGQIVTMTYTEIGNVGVNPEDDESARPFLAGLRGEGALRRAEQLARARIARRRSSRAARVPGIAGIDTRALVRRIRDRGFQIGVRLDGSRRSRTTRRSSARAKARPSLDGRDLVAEVTCAAPYEWSEGAWARHRGQLPRAPRPEPRLPRRGLRLRREAQHPAPARRAGLRRDGRAGEDVGRGRARARPDGVFLSNGPGDPAAVAGVPRDRARARRSRRADLRHLPRPPDPRPRARRQDREAQVRTPRRQPARARTSHTEKVAICAENHGYAVDADFARAPPASPSRSRT